MTCGAVESGDRFLSSSVTYLECTGRTLGLSGYQSLATAPVTGSILLALLTLFIAIIGLRLMFGRPMDFGDASIAAVKLGFVLMLALSWPAVQALVFTTVTSGPSQIVDRLAGTGEPIESRMQRIDSGVVALTAWGTGKLDVRAGQTASGTPAASAFAAEATNESLALSLGRIILITTVLIFLGAVLLASGLLIALLPLFAGFFLFSQTRSLFFGWAKSMAYLFFAGVAFPAIFAIQANVMEPWLQRVIAEREQTFATPSAPLELLALTAAFAMVLAFTAWLLARVCFNTELTTSLWQSLVMPRCVHASPLATRASTSASHERFAEVSRATHLASVLDIASRRETSSSSRVSGFSASKRAQPARPGSTTSTVVSGTDRRAQPREAQSRTRRGQR